MSKVLSTLVKPKKRLQNFVATPDEEKTIQDKADKYARGNKSEWLRHAAMNHVPNKKDMKNEG